MEWWRRVRADVSRPEVPPSRDLFLAGAAPAIVAIAHMTDPGTPLELAGLAPAVVVTVARGLGARVPAEVFAAVAILSVTLVVGNHGNFEATLFFPVMATLYAAWYLRSTIRSGAVLLASAGSVWIVAEHLAPESNINWGIWAGASIFTFALGLTLCRQRSLIEQLEAARDALARQAVAEERRRIARELHDLAGHTLAAMLLHVTGARHVADRDPDEARRALLDAEEVGRASLDQIRATVVALRADERGTDPPLAGSADLGDLIAAYRRAGLRVDACIDAASGHLAGPTGAAVHRIVQEALANVARHAPGNEVEATVSTADDQVTLTVIDRGRRPSPHGDGAPHFGLIGMRERARALGGDLVAGPHDDGWKVEATLPSAGPGRDDAEPAADHVIDAERADAP